MIIEITRFELRRMLNSPGNWLVIASCQFLLALIFYNLLSKYLSDPALFNGRGMTDAVVAGYYRSTGLLFLLITPFITMKLISEEIKNGSFKLLLSAPLTDIQILFGKYFSALIVLLFLLFLISLVPLSLAFGTDLDFGQIFMCLLGNLALIICLVAIGLFFSALFSQQSLAAVMSFIIIILLWTAHAASGTENTVIDNIFNLMSMSRHFTRFTEGVFDTTSLLYFFIVALVFLTAGIKKIHAIRSIHW